MSADPTKVRVERVSKIFGPEPEAATRLMEAGKGKDEIYAETGSVVAVADVSFEVDRGEVFVVMGLSGSGKSTLVRCINRLIEPTTGSVLVDGEDVVAADEKRLREVRLSKMTMVFQHFALFPHRTVAENVEYGLKIKGIDKAERREAALAALDKVGLRPWADEMPGKLSGGMQQRVGLARGLAVDAEVMLMDEPFSALDPLIRKDMQQELIALQDEIGMTIVFITHDLHEALLLGDQIAIMKDGRFDQIGSPQEIVADPATDYVEAFTRDVDRGRVFTAATVMREPALLDPERDTVRDALERMAELGRGALFVAGKDAAPAGYVDQRDAAVALGEGGATLADLLRTDYPTVAPEAHLIDLYELCTARAPLAVIGRDGALAGVVEPMDVLAELAGGREGRRAASAAA